MSSAVVAVALLFVLAAVGSARASSPAGNTAIAFERITATDPNTGAFHSNIWVTTGGGRVRTVVKRRGLSAIDPSWSPDGRAIAFADDCSFKYRLTCSSVWRINVDGRGLRKLSNGVAQDYCPAWSPDGRRIAFWAAFEGNQNLTSGIYLMNADGSSRTAVDKGDGCPAWSPDGSELVFSRTNALYVVGANGAGERQIATGVGYYDSEPDWSPDGTRIAFAKTDAHGPHVYVVNVDGTGVHSIARGASPAWSPSGQKIAFARRGEIYVISAAGGRAVRVTRRPMHSAGHPAWRPRRASR